MTEHEMQYKLGRAARTLGQTLTSKAIGQFFCNGQVITSFGKAGDVVGSLFGTAFGPDFLQKVALKHSTVYDPAWVMYKVLQWNDGLITNFLHDIAMANDGPKHERHKRIIDLLNELADYCLYEGCFYERQDDIATQYTN